MRRTPICSTARFMATATAVAPAAACDDPVDLEVVLVDVAFRRLAAHPAILPRDVTHLSHAGANGPSGSCPAERDEGLGSGRSACVSDACQYPRRSHMSTNEPPAPGEPTPPPPPARRRLGHRRRRPRRPPAATPPPPPPARPPRSACRAPASWSTASSPSSSTASSSASSTGSSPASSAASLITGYRSGAEVYFYYLIIGVLSSVLYLGYFAYMESSRGQTIGKMVMKLKVVRSRRREQPDHGAGRPPQHLARRRPRSRIVPFVGYLLGGLASLGAVILIAIGINSDTVKRQHWFDTFAGGTQVHEGRLTSPVVRRPAGACRRVESFPWGP